MDRAIKEKMIHTINVKKANGKDIHGDVNYYTDGQVVSKPIDGILQFNQSNVDTDTVVVESLDGVTTYTAGDDYTVLAYGIELTDESSITENDTLVVTFKYSTVKSYKCLILATNKQIKSVSGENIVPSGKVIVDTTEPIIADDEIYTSDNQIQNKKILGVRYLYNPTMELDCVILYI